jgi:hypothetical protein
MTHIKQVTKTQRPAMAQGVADCFKGFLEGEYPLCCGFPSFVDCAFSELGKGDAA